MRETVDHTAGEASPAHFEQYECGLFYVPFDLINERSQSNVTAQWRDHRDLNWDKVSNHSQNYLTTFIKDPCCWSGRGLIQQSFTIFVQKYKSWIVCLANSWKASPGRPADRQTGRPADRCSPTWANRAAHFWQKWGNQSKRQLCKELRIQYYPASRGPSIFLDKSMEGPPARRVVEYVLTVAHKYNE